MKKIKISVIAVFTIAAALFLVACGGGKDKKAVETAKKGLEIGFTSPDTKDSVTSKLTLPSESGDVSIEWTSSDATVVSATGLVTRKDVDTKVTLTATLTLNKETDTKAFEVNVIKVAVKGNELITEHYKNTLGSPSFKVTEDLDLIDEIGGLTVTWTVTSEFIDGTGKLVKQPTFTQGDQAATLRAVMSDGTTKTFIVSVLAAEQTNQEKVTAALDFVTIKSSGEFQEGNFPVVEKYEIDGQDVPVSWVTSDESLMNAKGELQLFIGTEPAEVTLTATITFGGITESRVVTFKVKPVMIYNSFTAAYADTKKGDKIYVEGVTYYGKLTILDGHYLSSPNNGLAYTHSSTIIAKEGKVYDVLATIDIYNGFYQLTNIDYRNERDGAANVITPEVVTVAQYHEMDKDANHYPRLYQIKDARLGVAGSGNYDTWISDKTLTVAPDNLNSLNVYYKSNKSAIQALNGIEVKAINVVHKGYHGTSKVWHADYIGDTSELELVMNPQQAVDAAENLLKAGIPANILKNTTLTTMVNNPADVTVAWTSSEPTVITTEGVVTVPATRAEVTLTAVITSTVDETATKTITIKTLVGLPLSATVKQFLALAKGEVRLLEGIITGTVGNSSTFSLQDADGNSVALRLASGDTRKLAVGDKIVAAVEKAEFNGLIQAQALIDVTTHENDITIVVTNLNEEELTNENLIKFQSHKFILEGLYIKEVKPGDYIEITFVRLADGQEIKGRWKTNLTESLELKVNDLITLDGAFLGWYKTDAQVVVENDSQVVVIPGEATDGQKLSAALGKVNIQTYFNAETTVALTKTGIFGSTFTWAFKDAENADNALINLETGKVTLPVEVGSKTVTLVVTGVIGTETLSKEFVVTIETIAGTLMIYEVYGGGGNAGAPYKNDYVILYNGTDAAINLDGYSIQYGSATGEFASYAGNLVELTGTIESKGFFVIILGTAEDPQGVDLPMTANVTGDSNMGASNGKVALAKTTDKVTGLDHDIVVDLVGFGTANLFEGEGATKAPSNSTSIKRNSFVDTNDNSKDFLEGEIDLSYLA